MAFEFSTSDSIVKIVEGIRTDTLELTEVRARLWPAMEGECTPERELLVDLANRVERLALSVALLGGVLVEHFADEMRLREIHDD